jgi:membrane protease YdiL (CAAX protease family)
VTTPIAHPLRTPSRYLVVATLLCFAVASPVILGALPADAAGVLVPIAQTTPAIAALGFFLVHRRGRFASVFAVRWGGSWPAIAVGLLAVAVIGLVQLGLALASGASIRGADLIVAAAAAVPIVLLLQCVFAIGEELGWRGWLVTQLAARPFWQIAAASSLAWMIWHLPALPLVIGDGGWQPGAAYLLAIASWAPFLVALRLWSGSVWPAVVVHGALNSIRVFLTQSVAAVDGVDWVVEIAGCVLWLTAAAVVHARFRRRTTARPDTVRPSSELAERIRARQLPEAVAQIATRGGATVHPALWYRAEDVWQEPDGPAWQSIATSARRDLVPLWTCGTVTVFSAGNGSFVQWDAEEDEPWKTWPDFAGAVRDLLTDLWEDEVGDDDRAAIARLLLPEREIDAALIPEER